MTGAEQQGPKARASARVILWYKAQQPAFRFPGRAEGIRAVTLPRPALDKPNSSRPDQHVRHRYLRLISSRISLMARTLRGTPGRGGEGVEEGEEGARIRVSWGVRSQRCRQQVRVGPNEGQSGDGKGGCRGVAGDGKGCHVPQGQGSALEHSKREHLWQPAFISLPNWKRRGAMSTRGGERGCQGMLKLMHGVDSGGFRV